MNNGNRVLLKPIAAAATALSLGLGCVAAANAQAESSGTGAPTGSTPAPTGGSGASAGPSDPNPYYIGVAQAFTRDSNVYRVPSGPGDTYSSTSLFGGFIQPISRQRVYGRANVSENRYKDEKQLNNTSFDFLAGIDWETIESLSGTLSATFNRGLSAPAAIGINPVATRNISETKGAEFRIRYGGTSLLMLEGGLNYSSIDYSAPEYVTAESSRTGANVNFYYQPGGPLRLGVGARVDRTYTPQSFIDPATGEYRSTTFNGQHFDLLADYEVTGQISANARLSYTHQKSTSVASADFSGPTGGFGLSWRPTAKLTVRADAARDAGFSTTAYTAFAFTTTPNGIVLSPVAGLYENNQLASSAGIGINYEATAKIGMNLGARYIRSRLTNVSAIVATEDIIDASAVVSLGVNYEITRSWGASCNASSEWRDVSGGTVYSYRANIIGCSTRFTWR